MTKEEIALALTVGGVVIQAVAAYVFIRVALAVLGERLNGHRALTEEKFRSQQVRFDSHEETLGAHDREIQRLRDWRHDEVSPMLQAHEGRIAALEEQED